MVTDADRICAAEIGRRFAKWTERQIEMTLAGEGDDAGIIQLISAHREAAERAGAQAMQDRIATWLLDVHTGDDSLDKASVSFSDAIRRGLHEKPGR